MPLCGQRPLRGPSRMNQKRSEEEEDEGEGGGRHGGNRKKTKKRWLVRLKNIGLDLTPIEIRESLLKVARRERNEVTGRVMLRARSLARCCYPLRICARQSHLIEETVDQSRLYRRPRRLTHYDAISLRCEMDIAARARCRGGLSSGTCSLAGDFASRRTFGQGSRIDGRFSDGLCTSLTRKRVTVA